MAVLCLACNNAPSSSKKAPPPPPQPNAAEYCDSLKARTYTTLKKGIIELVTDEFPTGVENAIEKRKLFEKILKEKFDLKLLPVFDSTYYPHCIMPIMDSAIDAKYGINSKDSIIARVNKLVDSMYLK